jgi:hypothetical protein
MKSNVVSARHAKLCSYHEAVFNTKARKRMMGLLRMHWINWLPNIPLLGFGKAIIAFETGAYHGTISEYAGCTGK